MISCFSRPIAKSLLRVRSFRHYTSCKAVGIIWRPELNLPEDSVPDDQPSLGYWREISLTDFMNHFPDHDSIYRLRDIVPVKKYDISGSEYERFNAVLKNITPILKSKEIPNSNLLDVDSFLYYVTAIAEKAKVVEVEPEEEFDH